jgi:hypothetical protein
MIDIFFNFQQHIVGQLVVSASFNFLPCNPSWGSNDKSGLFYHDWDCISFPWVFDVDNSSNISMLYRLMYFQQDR